MAGPPRRPPARRAVLAALVLAVPAFGAGCGESPVSPLPPRWPTPGVGSPVAPTASHGPPSAPKTSGRPAGPAPGVGVTPTATRTSGPPPSPACLGRVIHTIDGNDNAGLPEALCVTVGAVLRIRDVGPEVVSAQPAEKVAQDWEAGIANCRFLGSGTVTVMLDQSEWSHRITVLVVDG